MLKEHPISNWPSFREDNRGILLIARRMILGVLVVAVAVLFMYRAGGFQRSKQAEVQISGDSVSVPVSLDSKSFLGCQHWTPGETSGPRVVVIGDVHGDYIGMLEDLFVANLTSSATECSWRGVQQEPTLLVQMGDLVDRGAGALEALDCLRNLQATAAKNNAEVVRLLGNHELWWLTGLFHMRNRLDTEPRILRFLKTLYEDVMEGKIVASYIHRRSNEKEMFFVHAGFTADFLQYLHKLNITSLEEIANYTNDHLRSGLQRCTRLPCPQLTQDELYEAGPSRGGSGIGGPYWTDFDSLVEEDERRLRSTNNFTAAPFFQIVGHTMAFCYDPRRIGIHPPDSVAECAMGLVRSTPAFSSVCVDGGMYAGARAFLDISSHGEFVAHEYRPTSTAVDASLAWRQILLSRRHCSDSKRTPVRDDPSAVL